MNIEEIENFQKIGEGKCANIYTNKGNVYKILKQNSDSRKFYNREMLERLVGIKSDLCVFPNEILEDENGELLGYTMDLVVGTKMRNVIKSLSFEELQEVILQAEKHMEEISNKIICEDMHEDNVMWDEENNSIKIIDTDFFKKVDDGLSHSDANNSKLSSAIENMITISDYGKTVNQEFIPFYSSRDLNYKDGKRLLALDYILNIKSVMEKDFNRQFNNLAEIEEALQEKQEEVEWQQWKEEIANNLSIKEKIIRFLANSERLRKLPFVDKIITKQIKMLPLDVQEVINESNTNNLEPNEEVNETNSVDEKRNKFVEDISVEIDEENLIRINKALEETVVQKGEESKSEDLEI